MNEIASQGQLRLAYLRWALVTVPAIVFLGFLSGRLANSGFGNRWFASLDLPAITPPGWVFGVVWPILYIMLGLSLAMILHARGAKGRGFALTLFFVQLIANFAWSPLFFGQYQVTSALYLIIFILMTTAAVQGIKVDLPSASSAKTLEAQKSRVIAVSNDGTVSIDAIPVSMSELETQLRSSIATTPDLAVILRGDRAVQYDKVMQVLDLCSKVGVPSLGMASTRPPASAPGGGA